MCERERACVTDQSLKLAQFILLGLGELTLGAQRSLRLLQPFERAFIELFAAAGVPGGSAEGAEIVVAVDAASQGVVLLLI